MKLSSTISTTLLLGAPLVSAAPTAQSSHLSAGPPKQEKSAEETKKPWQVYSLREQPFNDAMLSFVFTDGSGQETDCKTDLPMAGFASCDDGKTSFIYGGVSYQYGETWLTVQRTDIEDCSETNASSTSTTKRDEASSESQPVQKQECKKRSAMGTLNLPSNFWQQPGWNSWVHPENLDLQWNWSS